MIVDVNAYLSRWPFRRLPCDALPAFLARMETWEIGQAWVGSFDGLFHRDIGGVNQRLADDCRKHEGRLLPFGSVNPKLPDWREDMRRCHEDYRMPGIRLHPNYHGYTLDDPAFAEVLDAAAERGLMVQIVVRMDDVRVQHPLMQIPDVKPGPILDLVAARPTLRLVVLNAAFAREWAVIFDKLAAVGNVSVDFAMQEGVGGVSRLIEKVSLNRVLFGSHFPLFELESAVFKLRESELTAQQLAAISHENAERLLGGPPGVR
jgi:hypothetical protein